ncbi:MAG: hypothetical protein M0R17_02950 [Candidatus Omnitrophica bacterium]|jgi:hypothetical protein|nr:hypothetical protein [Candidatus Omnitrophota bacterium]
MKLSIIDLRAVLKERTQLMVGRKASEDPVEVLAGVKDIRVVLDELETLANELLLVKEQLENEAENI